MILLDVGVWLAALWGRHVHHRSAAGWLDAQTADLAICRATQLSLLRLLSNPMLMDSDALTRSEAWRVLDAIRSDDRIMWADEPAHLDLAFRAISAHDDRSHKLWTDDYLAAFAHAADATLVTLDTKLSRRYPSITVHTLI